MNILRSFDMPHFKNEKVRNALCLGVLCSVAYFGVYVVRNVLSAVSPQMVDGGFTNEYIGEASSVFFIFYAFGQLINGIIGDKIKARYMMSLGLLIAGALNISFPFLTVVPNVAVYAYGFSGFFLAMIYGPMTKVIAENTEHIYAARCSLGYNFASYIGSPVAGIMAAVMTWQCVFYVSSGALIFMAIVVFVCFLVFEKRGIVKYNQYKTVSDKKGGSIKVLIQNKIIKFTVVSVLTGVIRTTVVFWLPTYIKQYLGFSNEVSVSIYTVATLVISLNAFVAIFVYERLKRNMDLTMLVSFTVSTLSFLGAYLFKQPVLNIVFMVLAILASNCATTMLWSIYCPSLRDTGMVSGATGYLDFMSYMAASLSSKIFSSAVDDIGWGMLILVWAGLTLCGIVLTLPYDKILKHKKA